MQGDSWRDAIALIKTYGDLQAGGRTTDQVTKDRILILQDSEPRLLALALAQLAAVMLRQLEQRGLDAESLFADVRAAAERGLGGL